MHANARTIQKNCIKLFKELKKILKPSGCTTGNGEKNFIGGAIIANLPFQLKGDAIGAQRSRTSCLLSKTAGIATRQRFTRWRTKN
jgi:hypothetical protein